MKRGARAISSALLLAGAASVLALPAAMAATYPSPGPNGSDEFGTAAERAAAYKVLGPLAISPLTGNLDTYMTVISAGGCPGGTNIILRAYGKGFPEAGENVIGNTEVAEYAFPTVDRMKAPLTITLEEARRKQPPGTKLSGVYTLKMDCQEAFPTKYTMVYGIYQGKLRIAPDGTYTALTTEKDLPRSPTPKAGTAAVDLGSKPQVSEEAVAAEEKELEAQKTKTLSDAAQASAEKDDSSSGTAAIAFGLVVLVLGGSTAAAVFARRSARVGAGR